MECHSHPFFFLNPFHLSWGTMISDMIGSKKSSGTVTSLGAVDLLAVWSEICCVKCSAKSGLMVIYSDGKKMENHLIYKQIQVMMCCFFLGRGEGGRRVSEMGRWNHVDDLPFQERGCEDSRYCRKDQMCSMISGTSLGGIQKFCKVKKSTNYLKIRKNSEGRPLFGGQKLGTRNKCQPGRNNQKSKRSIFENEQNQYTRET